MKCILRLSITLITFLSFQSYGQAKTRDSIKEQQIEKQLYAIDSSIVNTFSEATKALDENNLQLSDSLYSLVYAKAPTFDPCLRRLGIIRFNLGKVKEGLDLCTKAVEINRSAYNLLTLASCYTYKGITQNQDKALELLNEAKGLPNGDDVDIFTLLGQIELQKNNISEFRATTNLMLEKYPKEMATHYFAAILAYQDQDWKNAKKEILIAKEYGLSNDLVNEFLNSGVNSKATKGTIINILLIVLIVWISGLLALYIVGKVLSNITVKSIEKKKILDDSKKAKNRLRAFYKILINLGGIYYYLSLPIILILVVALVVGLFYLFLVVGRIPIKLMLILVIGSGFTIYGMVRSLLLKVKYTDPGRELTKEEAPDLYKLTGEVARDISTRAIDEIRITLGTDLAVYEKGTWKEKLQDKAKRILILGAGVIKDFKQNDFKAILAHEYGHFSNRDTAGGDVALRVRNDIDKYFYTLYVAGQNLWWNLAFQFLRIYNFIFRRISYGSTRLQEVLADKVAATTYGFNAFENGLKYVIRRDIEFHYMANKEVGEAKQMNRSIQNLYELKVDKSNSDIDEEYNKILSSNTSHDDTHPSPADRFRYLANINTQSIPDGSGYVKELFVNWDSISQEMNNLLLKEINKNRK